MKTVILNGNPDPAQYQLDTYLSGLADQLSGISTQQIILRDLNYRSCTGCFGCWTKTPGECVFVDDSAPVLRAMINSDLVIYASPLIMGFVSSLTKHILDRSIPLVHPYATIRKGEVHHRKRYDHIPKIGLLLENTPGSDREDVDITAEIFERIAASFSTKLAFVKTMDDSFQEVRHAVDHL